MKNIILTAILAALPENKRNDIKEILKLLKGWQRVSLVAGLAVIMLQVPELTELVDKGIELAPLLIELMEAFAALMAA